MSLPHSSAELSLWVPFPCQGTLSVDQSLCLVKPPWRPKSTCDLQLQNRKVMRLNDVCRQKTDIYYRVELSCHVDIDGLTLDKQVVVTLWTRHHHIRMSQVLLCLRCDRSICRCILAGRQLFLAWEIEVTSKPYVIRYCQNLCIGKTAEPIEIYCGMLSWVNPGKHVLDGVHIDATCWI